MYFIGGVEAGSLFSRGGLSNSAPLRSGSFVLYSAFSAERGVGKSLHTPLAERSSLPALTFHRLLHVGNQRHTCATLPCSAPGRVEVSLRMGQTPVPHREALARTGCFTEGLMDPCALSEPWLLCGHRAAPLPRLECQH